AVTGRAGRHGDELPEERALRAPHLADARTSRAHLRLRSWFGPGALAPIARIEETDRDLLVDARRDVGEREWHSHLHVLAGTRTVAVAACRRAEHLLQSAEPAEIPHEDPERLGEVDVVKAAAAAAQAGFAVAIVRRALLRIAQHVVRFRDVLEPLFGLFRAVVAVRMIRHRELAV